MSEKATISRIFFYLVFSLILAFSLGGVFYSIDHEYQDYKREVFMIRDHYIEIKKSIIKQEVQSIIRFIDYRKSIVRSKLEKELMDRTYEAYNYAINTYDKYSGTMKPPELKEVIKSFFKLSKYKEGRGYYFVIRRDGLIEVGDDSRYEGRNARDFLDCEGQAIVKELDGVSLASGEGMIEYRWNNSNHEGCLPKLSFVKYFAPFDWYISTGEYLDQVEAQLQNDVLQWLKDLHGSDDSYISACTFDGVVLSSYDKEDIGSNQLDRVDPNKVKIVQERIRLAGEDDGGFLEYVAPTRPTTGEPARKISFFSGVPDWRWVIGSGFYLDEVDAFVAAKKAELSRNIAKSIMYIIGFFALITGGLIAVLRHFSARINASMQALCSFFDRAANESSLVDAGAIEFKEFHRLAISANRMVRKRQKVVEDLRESEARYRAIVDDQSELICRFLPDSSIIFVNEAFCRFFNTTRTELIGRSFLEKVHESDLDSLKKQIARLDSQNPVCSVDLRFGERHGQVQWLQWAHRAIFDYEGSLIEYQAVGRNITEQKRAEDALHELARFQQLMIDTLPVPVYYKDEKGHYLGCNKAFEGLWAKSRTEILGATFFDISDKQQAQICCEKDMELLRKPGAQVYESDLRIPGGGKLDVIFHKASFPGPNGSAGGLIGAIVDISGQKRAEAERTRLVTAIEQCAEGVLIADNNFTIHYVNPAFERQSGYRRTEILGQRMKILKSERQDRLFYDEIRETLLRGEVWSGRLINRRRDGSAYEAETTASPVRDASGKIINFVAIHRDITNEVKLEKELRQAQKMEAIGTLSGGIAHDFNNILTAIIGYTEISRHRLPDGSPLCETLDQVLKAGQRAKDLVKQILTFSRQSEQEREPVQVKPVVEEVLKLVRSSLPSTIEIRQRIEIKPGEGIIFSAPSQIHQVLMNLCANAAHAMRGQDGVLSVNVSRLEIDRLAPPPCGLKPDTYILIAVSDTGHGMDAAVMERIFDPYFTTKEPGEGTGMGLATVQGIVKGHGGAVDVYSEPGKGTSFKVYLPMVSETVTPCEAEVVDEIAFGSERILFVDDEKALAELGKEMLESMGYKVTSRTGSLEALETFRSAPNEFDLVITDMTMPVITGVELCRKCKALRPDIPVILCTGFSDPLIGTKPEELGICEVLLKPYEVISLTRAIRKALDQNVRAK